MCHYTFFGRVWEEKKTPERDKVRNLIMIGNLGQRRHTEWARKGGRFQYGWAIARETVADALKMILFSVLLSAFQQNAAASFSTMLPKLPTQKVSGSCAARPEPAIIPPKGYNRLQSFVVWQPLWFHFSQISLVLQWVPHSSHSHVFDFPSQTPAAKPPAINAAKKKKKISRKLHIQPSLCRL